mmetsp:Transcript_138762/g.241297  ORF Transcript_138762/g.241297 Transcript_138762/m.241297 type:complete len:127 (+) Transcript_138762:908-1288(+)
MSLDAKCISQYLCSGFVFRANEGGVCALPSSRACLFSPGLLPSCLAPSSLNGCTALMRDDHTCSIALLSTQGTVQALHTMEILQLPSSPLVAACPQCTPSEHYPSLITPGKRPAAAGILVLAHPEQ